MRTGPVPVLSRREALRIGASAFATAFAGTSAALAGETVTLGADQDVFAREKTSGTFVAYDAAVDRLTVLNAARAGTRFSPASTFKIANSLIALEIGAVKDADEMFRYDRKPRAVAAWQKDMTLREAVAVSNVPVFQEIARRVGLAAYREWLGRLDYGNREVGTDVEHFWLRGPLAISAIEQARFVARVAAGTLPMSTRAQAIVRDIMRNEEKDGRALFAKTGWDGRIGWWTGWVEQAGRNIAFALNMDMSRIEEAPRRISIGKALLERLGAY